MNTSSPPLDAAARANHGGVDPDATTAAGSNSVAVGLPAHSLPTHSLGSAADETRAGDHPVFGHTFRAAKP